MATEITEQVSCITSKYHRGEVNCYLVKGKRGVTVVDAGFNNEGTKQEWERLISEGLRIEKVVITHNHPDHNGLGAWFQKHVGVPVILGRKSYEDMKRKRQRLVAFQGSDQQLYPFIRMHDGPLFPEKEFYKMQVVEDYEPDELFDEHETVVIGDEPYEAIWTPGHAKDHYCFWNPDRRTMVIGDHLLGDICPVIPMWNEHDGNPLQVYFDSLDKIEAYDAALVLPGHGGPIANLAVRVEETRENHRMRLAQMLEMIREKAKTAGQISRELYGEFSALNVQTAFFITSTISRLTYLESAGRVEKRLENDGKFYYYRME